MVRRTVLGIALVASCADDPSTVRKTLVEVGSIEVDQSGRAAIAAPATAQIGSDVIVSVMTVGDACYSVESTEVTQSADGGDLTPYDRQIVPVGPTQACPLDREFFPHSGTFQFATAGTKTVTVHGLGDVAYSVMIDVL